LEFGFFLVFGVWSLVFSSAAADIRLITLDPGHFHAALFQREMLPGVAEKAYVYAPIGPDLTAHLNRVAQFNLRRENPTHWNLQVRTGTNFFERMLAERHGNVVVIAGNNRSKIDRILAIVRARMNVLADEPWIIEPGDLPKLEAALDAADKRHVIAYDTMTLRFETAGMLQRELVHDREIFGEPIKGTLDEPGVYLESRHCLLKEVGGLPDHRPAWFFDIRQQGEGLADVGTHLVERAQWTLFPNQAIDYKHDIEVLQGTRWPRLLTREQFQRVTGESEFPEFLQAALKDGHLEYFCNNRVSYTLRGVHVTIEVKWDFEAPPGGHDSQTAIFRGSKSRVEVRQGKEEQYQAELFIVPATDEDKAGVRDVLMKKVAAFQKFYPGIALDDGAGQFHIAIPETLRPSHEETFAFVCRRFLNYVRHPKSLPAWEKPNMLAKYYVTTKGIELARQKTAKPSGQ
jgi:predicted dehydrogenase